MKLGRILLIATAGAFSGRASQAAEGIAEPWEWWHQAAATPVMEHIGEFHYLLFWIMVAICALVVALIAYVLIRYNAARNPTPSRTSHNTAIEVTWTVLPVIILVVIAIPSFRLLYYTDRAVDPEMTLKVIGHQWYWEYEYPDNGGFAFASVMIPEEELQSGQPRLLAVDNRVVLPVDTTVRIQVTADDVLHSWAIPAFGVKTDAVPGQLNETWARIEEEGIYYGQCSELCGLNHGYMPIAVEAVSKERFTQWVEEAKARFAKAQPPAQASMQLAQGQVSVPEGNER